MKKKKLQGNLVMAVNEKKHSSYMRCEINGVVHEASGSAEEVIAKFNEAVAKAFGKAAIEGTVRGK